MTEASAPSYRLKLPCSDEREFREKFLQKYVSRGIFVPSERPKPVGTRLKLKLEIRGGTVLVSGDGMVTSVAQAGTAKPGMTVRLTTLHPESIQFSLSPSGGAAPQPPAPAPPARATPPALVRPATTPAPPPLSRPATTPAPPSLARPASTPAPPAPPAPPPPPLRASEDEGLFDLDDPLPAAPDDGVMASTDPAIPVPFELLEPDAIVSEAAPEPPRSQEPAPTPPPAAAPAAKAARAAPSKRLILFIAAGVVVAGIAAIGAVGASRSARAAREHAARVDEQLRIADLRMLEGRLASAGGDSALDHLLEAKGLASNDARVATRLRLLADKFEQLGGRAVARKNLREASVHYRAALMADPARANARAKLDELEAKLKGSTPSR